VTPCSQRWQVAMMRLGCTRLAFQSAHCDSGKQFLDMIGAFLHCTYRCCCLRRILDEGNNEIIILLRSKSLMMHLGGEGSLF